MLESLGSAWRVAEMSHKPYPSGRATHGGIEGITALREQHGFGADDVDSVVVRGPPLIVRLCGRPAQPGMTPNYARLCMGFAAANVLRHGRLDLAQYRGQALNDPATLGLAARVRMEVDGNPDPNALVPQDVIVTLRDGRELHWHCDAMLAGPARRLTREQHLAKFHRCWKFAADPLDDAKRCALIARVDRLEDVADVRELAELLQP